MINKYNKMSFGMAKEVLNKFIKIKVVLRGRTMSIVIGLFNKKETMVDTKD